MTETQKSFLKDLVASLKDKQPLHYADQTRIAMLVEAAFPEVFVASNNLETLK